jgi:hypothetical protein
MADIPAVRDVNAAHPVLGTRHKLRGAVGVYPRSNGRTNRSDIIRAVVLAASCGFSATPRCGRLTDRVGRKPSTSSVPRAGLCSTPNPGH